LITVTMQYHAAYLCILHAQHVAFHSYVESAAKKLCVSLRSYLVKI